MEPLTVAVRAPSPLAGLLELVPTLAVIVTVVGLPIAMFETGRELARYVAWNQVASAIIATGVVLNLARPCRCSWMRR